MVFLPDNPPNVTDNIVISEDGSRSGLEKALPTNVMALRKEKPDMAITRNLVIYAVATILVMIATTITLTIITLNMELVIDKKIWGGRPSSINFTEPLQHPTPYVIVSHTAGKFCRSFTECAPIIQNIQGQHMTKHSDIRYNFLIGGDGNVYLGRGWDIQNSRSNNSIAVSFIGNFVYDHLSKNMAKALTALLKSGVKLNKLDSDYKLVPDNQTQTTVSPGEKAFKELVLFPNYYPEKLEL